jgi:hypothetical protein
MKKIFWFLFLVQAGINLAGAVGPEISFDALWYHLPLSRLAIERGWWGVIPGGLLYYSGLPGMGRWINASFWAIGGEVLVKVVHWGFGVGSAGMIYKLARRYFEKRKAMMAGVVWYSSLVVGWTSITAYADLIRTFLILIGIWYLVEQIEEKKERRWFWSAFFLGMAYSVKAVCLAEGVVLGFLFGFLTKKKINSFKYWGVLGLFVLFWGLVNIRQGYGPFYPFLEYKVLSDYSFFSRGQLLGPMMVFFDPRYRVGPIVLILMWMGKKKLKLKKVRVFLMISIGMAISWFLMPRSGFGRFFLLSLGLFSILGTGLGKKRAVVGLVLLSSLAGIFYRGAANSKFIPYLLGKESKDEFLSKNLNFEFADWYDTDGWVRENLTKERYLVKGVHNTYYLPGNFDHESWAETDYCYRYVLVQGEGFEIKDSWKEIHGVKKTRTEIFEDRACLL